MILRITAEGFELGAELNKYARTKIDVLDKYLAQRDRPTTLIEVLLSEKSGTVQQRTCEIIVKLRRQELHVKETTQHMYVSLDVAVADMEQQLHSYRRQNPGPIRRYAQQTKNRLQSKRSKSGL